MNHLYSKESVLNVLSTHQRKLAEYKVKSIGLIEDKDFTPSFEISLTVVLEPRERLLFSYFMSLVHFLEIILNHKVVLFVQYSRRDRRKVVSKVKYIDIRNNIT